VAVVGTTVTPNNELTAQQVKLIETAEVNKHCDTELRFLGAFAPSAVAKETLGSCKLLAHYCSVTLPVCRERMQSELRGFE
jgi:hypothetical protein